MRFFSTAAFAASALFALVAAQNPNPITTDLSGPVEAGKPITITWTPTTEGEVTLVLRKGDTKNLDTIATIVADIDNSGSFTWTPDEDLEAGTDYAIEIRAPEGSNYSPKFQLDSDGTGLTKSTSATTSATTTATTTDVTTTAEVTSSATPSESSTTLKTSTTKTSEPSETSSTPEETEEADIPNTNSAAKGVASPLALILCIAAVLYLN